MEKKRISPGLRGFVRPLVDQSNSGTGAEEFELLSCGWVELRGDWSGVGGLLASWLATGVGSRRRIRPEKGAIKR